ncbi:Uncharacterized protein APZ42_006872 [Daphnia magna]|uniref:Uncharacterized protein n=1 Tax=Daphnia magna TaxID=35525 RepID=A0A164FNC7_9CRUS|nr:Uncharacterized protein APZ42_006872 [Daphnia magna]
MEQLFENIQFDVFDANFSRTRFLHSAVEHGSEDGAPGRQKEDMTTDRLVFIDLIETERNVTV